MRRSRASITVMVLGGLLLVAAAAWRPVAEPMLVRFPADLDETTRYEGTFTLLGDAVTGAALPAPIVLPLRLDRRTRAVPGASGAHQAVVEEAVTTRIGDTPQREVHHYVVDRRSMRNLADERSWAYDAGNFVDRRGTYRVTLPLGADADGRYRIWENEPGRGFWMQAESEDPWVREHGLRLLALREVYRDEPVAPYYAGELERQGFPRSLSWDQLVARLAVSGVDVDGILTGLSPALTPAEAATVEAATGAAVPLRYTRDNDGHALVEPRTGSIVELTRSVEGIAAAPDLAGLRDLRDVLAAHAGDPSTGALAGAFDALEGAPAVAVYELDYGQTPESAAAMAALARDQRRLLDWVERYVPAVALGLGLVAVALGLLLGRRQHRRSPRPVGDGASPPRPPPVATSAPPTTASPEANRVRSPVGF